MAEAPLDLRAIERAHLPCPHAEGEGPDPDCTLCALDALLAALRATRAALEPFGSFPPPPDVYTDERKLWLWCKDGHCHVVTVGECRQAAAVLAQVRDDA